jgi:hypothetical protein
MKKVKLTTIAIMLMAFASLSLMACNDTKKEDSNDVMHSEMDNSNVEMDSKVQNPNAKQVLADYMELKDALVATDESAATKAGKKLESTLKGFDVSNYTSEQQKELQDIIETSTEHAEHIGKSDIGHQREHFKMLTKDITDMIAITGTEKTLYQQFCPMYEDDGGAWLSMEKEIRNPYFGSKMMKCGEVQKEIN